MIALTDIHSHIIPDIDDGSSSLSESAVMLRLAADSGTKNIVATPHYYNAFQCTRRSSKAMVCEQYKKLKEYIAANNIDINLYLGAETFAVNNLSELIKNNEIISLNNSRYVLIEFDFNDNFDRVMYCTMQLKNGGYVPVIAHPERYVFLHRDPSLTYWFLENNCLLQINKGSVLGRYGEEERAFCRWLLDNRFVFAAASDAHSPFRRTTDMSESYEWVYIHYGKKYADDIFNNNPIKLLNNISIKGAGI